MFREMVYPSRKIDCVSKYFSGFEPQLLTLLNDGVVVVLMTTMAMIVAQTMMMLMDATMMIMKVR